MKDKKLSINFIVGLLGILLVVFFGLVIAKTGAWAFGIIPLVLAAIILAYHIFKNPFLGFLLIIFFLPFERVPSYELGGVDIRINTILGFMTIIAWLLTILFNGKKYKIQPNVLAIPLVLFVMALVLSMTQALNMDRALQVLVFILFVIALSIMTVNMLSDMDKLKKTILILFLSSLVTCVFGLFQFGGDVIGLPASLTLIKTGYTSATFGFPRIQAFSMEPLYFANYLLIPLSLGLAYFFAKVNLIKRWYLIGILALFLVNFVLTVSRGGYVGLAATLLVFILFYFHQVFTLRNLAIVLVFGLAFWGVYFALSQGEYRATKEFIGHATLQDRNKGESVQGRLQAFEVAINIFKRNPITGIGIGNYGPYIKGYPASAPKTGWPIVNNQYIELAAEAGLAGLTSFGLIIIILIYRSLLAFKKTQDLFLKATIMGFLAAFIGILAQYNFFSVLYIIHIWILIGLMVGVQNLVLRKQD